MQEELEVDTVALKHKGTSHINKSIIILIIIILEIVINDLNNLIHGVNKINATVYLTRPSRGN